MIISFAGLGDADVEGDGTGAGDSDGDGAVLGVVTSDGVASGDVVASWLGWVHPAKIKTNPATHAAGTAPLLTRL